MQNTESKELEEVIVRHATLEDKQKILDFIRDHWFIRNHVFLRHDELFDHCHIFDDKLSFYIGEGVETKKIYGMLAYCPNNYFTENFDISVTFYQTIKSSDSLLGVHILLKLIEETKCRVCFSPGIVKNTRGIYQFLGHTVGLMQHYYRLNDEMEYKIAVVNENRIAPATSDSYEMRQLNTKEEIDQKFAFENYKHIVPYRDSWSVSHRYFENIGYEYKIYGLFERGVEDHCDAMIVLREIECNGSKMCKIIDYIGDDAALGKCAKDMNRIIHENGYEYIDFYEVGIEDEIMEQAGFVLRDKKDPNIIPNYFEPFEQRNIDIYYYTTNPTNFHCYRTDSGQDRPNFIEELEEQ